MENFEKQFDENKTLNEINDLKNKIESKVPKLDNLSKLSHDPDIKNATEKIAAKCLEGTLVNKLFLNQDVFKNRNISTYADNIIKSNPELVFFMSTDLGINKIMDKKYEQLLASEKIRILALDQTLHSSAYSYKNEKGKIDVKKFKRAYAYNMKLIINNLSVDFKLTQLSNLGDIKQTLKNDYKLTDKESLKFIKYLEEIKKQPNNVQEAGGSLGYIIVLFAGILLGALGMNWYYNFTNPQSETVIQTGRVEIGDPRMIAKLLPVEADFKTAGSLKKEQFKINESDGLLKQQTKKLLNVAQNKEIAMEINGKFAVEFDLDNSTFEYDYTTKKIYAHLKKPTMIIIDSKAKILKKNSEVFEIKSFDNTEMELLDSLKKNVLLEGKNKDLIYEKAKKNAEAILQAIYSYPLKLGNVELKGVEVIIDQADPLEILQKNKN